MKHGQTLRLLRLGGREKGIPLPFESSGDNVFLAKDGESDSLFPAHGPSKDGAGEEEWGTLSCVTYHTCLHT